MTDGEKLIEWVAIKLSVGLFDCEGSLGQTEGEYWDSLDESDRYTDRIIAKQILVGLDVYVIVRGFNTQPKYIHISEIIKEVENG